MEIPSSKKYLQTFSATRRRNRSVGRPLSDPDSSTHAGFPARPAWPGVELRHLVAFQAVVSAGSFIGAANRLGYTQSGVSAQIRVLEQLIGVRLIDRSRGARGIALTKEGAIFLRYAREIARSFEAAAAHLGAGPTPASGALRVGSFRSATLGIAAPALSRLADDEPELQVALVENEDLDVLLDLLEEGNLDLAFAVAPVRKGFESIVLRQERHVAVVASESELAKLDAIRLDDLAGRRVITDNTGYGAMLARSAFDAGAVHARPVSDQSLAIALALAGGGIALLPELAVLPTVGATTVPLDADLPARAIALAWTGGGERSVGAELFARVAKAVAVRIDVVPPLID
jgi:DNA-binding transcriptional LysR family regulator